MSTKVAIVGATGKMGRLISGIVAADAEFEVYAELGSKSELYELDGADLVVDVTVPGASQSVVDYAVSQGINVLVGTSGWSGDRILRLEHSLAAHPETGVVIVPNFSLGSVLATAFATMAAQFYNSIEIVEAHGATKIDSPSGTAVRTAELIARARAGVGPVSAPHTDQRARGQQVASVPIHSLRLQGVVAKQDVIFGGTGEVLTLSHETISSSAYETGILLGLRAARTARGVTVGLDRLLDLDRMLAVAAARNAGVAGPATGAAAGTDAAGTDPAGTDAAGADPDAADVPTEPELVSGQAARATIA